MGPQRLKTIIGAQPRGHDVDDDVTVINKNPARIGCAFDRAWGNAKLRPHYLTHMRGDRVELPIGWRRANDKVVENHGQRAQIEQKGVLSLLVVGGGRRRAAEGKGTGVCGRFSPPDDGAWNIAFSFGGIIYF